MNPGLFGLALSLFILLGIAACTVNPDFPEEEKEDEETG